MLQRRDAVTIGDVTIRAGFEKHPDDLRVGRSTVAEDHGLEQRRPARVVDVVDVDLGPREKRAAIST